MIAAAVAVGKWESRGVGGIPKRREKPGLGFPRSGFSIAFSAAAGTATGTGVQKLEAVLANIGPAIDDWVSSNFPGAKQVSVAAKSGLITAVVGIMNEMGGGTVSASTPPNPAA